MRSALVLTHIEARVTLRVYIYIYEVVYCTAVELCFRVSVARKVERKLRAIVGTPLATSVYALRAFL